METLPYSELLAAAFLTTGLAAVVGLLFRAKLAEKLALGLLIFATALSAFVGGAVALGVVPSVAIVTPGLLTPFLFGMVFGLDRLSAIFFLLTNVVLALSVIFAIHHLEKYAYLYHLRLVAFLTALLAFGIQGALLATSTIGFVLFLEVIGLATYFLIMSDGSKVAREAAFKYFVMFELSTAAVIAGFFLLANGSDGLLSDFMVLASRAASLDTDRLMLASGLLFVGFAARAGIVPFHTWLPDAYTRAPAHISAIMCAATVPVALYGFLRTALFILPVTPLPLAYGLILAGLASAVIGVLLGSVENNIKRLLAYGSLEYSGIIFTFAGIAMVAGATGFIAFAQVALYALILLLLTHSFLRAALFLSAGVLTYDLHTETLEAMGGLAKKMPFFSVMACVLTLSVAAFPPSGIFVAEWVMVEAMLRVAVLADPAFKGLLVLTLITLFFVTGLSLFVNMKFFGIAFLARPRSLGAENAREPKRRLVLPIFVLTILAVMIGIMSPEILALLGATPIVSEAGIFSELRIVQGELMPAAIAAIFGIVVLFIYVGRRLLSDAKFERMQEPWSGGHPATLRMEYTSIAFSSAIRYFFRAFLKTQSRKAMTVTPLLTTNPWFTSKSFEMNIEPIWERIMYKPAREAIQKLRGFVKRVQYGNVQVHVAMILITLALSILIAL